MSYEWHQVCHHLKHQLVPSGPWLGQPLSVWADEHDEMNPGEAFLFCFLKLFIDSW